MVVVPSASPASIGPRANTESIAALVIDRQSLFVAALGSLLSGPRLRAHILSSSRSDVGLEIVRSSRVELVCCELHSEPMTGPELADVLGAERPDLPVILLGEAGDESALAGALNTRVAGLFTKSAAPDEFLSGVQAVLSGHRAVGSGIISQFTARRGFSEHLDSRRAANHLSPTELEILTMIGQAQSIPNIAANRGISRKTVRNHLAKIYRKLELHGRTEAMLWAARMGLIN